MPGIYILSNSNLYNKMKKILSLISMVMLVFVFHSFTFAKEKADIVVAKDGSGNYMNIQEAINSVPIDNKQNVIIFIRKGIYKEKIYITRSYITLVGEDRDSTKIIYAELRKNWVKEHQGSDWGSAVINIDSLVTDITLANITVHNNYGGLYGDHDHQFAIRGGGTRIIIVNCNILADGGDTLSLWNKKDGMYYHANCFFEGWVDFVCPRGWCYITDSRFFGHNMSASIWHDGDTDKDQKFVIRYSSFDGLPGFPLARHHRDAQFFLLDCIFMRNMADRPIYLPISPNSVPWIWGERHYFYNCHREGGDFIWFADNLESAENHPKANEITAKWTFRGIWDPEETMPSVLPFVFLPRPRDGSYNIESENVELKWTPARNAISHNIYFGRTNKPEFIRNQKEKKFTADKLDIKTTYFWRIDEITERDTLSGPLWHFTTK
jgi:pectinesterase